MASVYSALYNMVITGQRIWLSDHGDELRFNIETRAGYELLAYQSHLETLVITIKKLREERPNWSPREISLAYSSREALPDVELFAGSQISRGTGETYITIPKAMMGLRFFFRARSPAGNSEAPDWRLLPENLGDLVQLQLDTLLPFRLIRIDTIAESLSLSRRTLQRSLAEQGLSYSQLLTEVRTRRAAGWLERTDMPIAAIAYELGYTDASNFTRAFRRQIGVSPRAFRDNGKKG
jgi:AraC-like DNA-binding protein